LTEAVPDPQAEATFASAKLSWSWPEGTPRAGLRRLYRDLIAARRQWPALRDFESRSARLLPDAREGPILELCRGDETNGSIRIFFNLSERPHARPARAGTAWKPLFSSEAREYGGCRDIARAILELQPFECLVLEPDSHLDPETTA
jgi:maltooligosyltrehalose trehalohydrolase